jgi:phosphoserine/homoserine phosphotransferase
MIFAIDLEGVLAPEIWPILGARFELPDLSKTTRDVADFSELMHLRLAAIRQKNLTLADLQTIAHAVEPYLGARDLIERLRPIGNVVIISDTFHEFSDPLAAKLGGVSLFANRFALDSKGRIDRFRLRIRGKKERIISGFKSAGFSVSAMGDSMNDLSLLHEADFPILYRPVEMLLKEFPNAAVATNLDEALEYFEEARRRLDSENGS